MNPWILLAGAGAALYLFKRKKAAADDHKPLPSVPIPRPLPLPSPEGVGGAADFSNAWEVYPDGYVVLPPGAPVWDVPIPDSGNPVSRNPTCTTIVVADLWWDYAGELAEAAVAAGIEDPDAVFDQVLSATMPGCVGVTSPAMVQFTMMVKARLAEMMKQAVDAGMVGTGAAPPQLELGEGAQLFTHHKKGVGMHTIVLEPFKEYHPAIGQTVYGTAWRVWPPGSVVEGTHKWSGKEPTPQEALAEATELVDSYINVKPQGATVNGPKRNMLSRPGHGLGLLHRIPGFFGPVANLAKAMRGRPGGRRLARRRFRR